MFGDGIEDGLCMFGQGWLSIAMGNARDALKAKADYITTDVDKDGLWNACKHFGWILRRTTCCLIPMRTMMTNASTRTATRCSRPCRKITLV